MIGADQISSVSGDFRRKMMWAAIEGAASVFTLAGIYLGSTTVHGALFYLASLPFWFGIMIGKQAWGLLPLNVFTLVTVMINLVKALQ